MPEFNEMCFGWKQDAMRLIDLLVSLNMEESVDHYNDISITREDGGIVVRWVQKPYSGEYGGSFQYIDENYVVKKRRKNEL